MNFSNDSDFDSDSDVDLRLYNIHLEEEEDDEEKEEEDLIQPLKVNVEIKPRKKDVQTQSSPPTTAQNLKEKVNATKTTAVPNSTAKHREQAKLKPTSKTELSQMSMQTKVSHFSCNVRVVINFSTNV